MSTEVVNEVVPISELVQNRIQARVKLGSDIKYLANSIEAQGLHNPVQVWRTTNEEGVEELIVLGGHRRLAAIQMLIDEGRANGLGEGVPVRIFDAETEQEARAIALTNNVEQEALTGFEIATECKILKDLGQSQKDIARLIGRSEAWVSRKLATLEAATPELKKAWKAGKLPDESVEAIAAMETEKEQETAVEKALAVREVGGRKGASQSRAEVKATTGKGKSVKLGAKATQELIQMLEEREEDHTEYLRGMYDALRLSQGAITTNKLDPEFKTFTKAVAQYRKELAAASAAEEAAEAKKKIANAGKKKGKKSDDE